MADPGRRFVGEPQDRHRHLRQSRQSRHLGERRDAAGAGAFEFFPIDTDRPHLRELAVELGIEAADAFDEGRVGGQQSGEPLAGKGVGEKHVTGLGGLGVVDARPLGQPADLLERPANAVGVARELDGAGVGQVLALPRHRRHDQPTEERSHQAQREHAHAQHHLAGTGDRKSVV